MENFSTTTIPEYRGYNDSFHQQYENFRRLQFILRVFTWVMITVGLPLTIVVICALCLLVRKDHVAPIYVINLLISDLIQFCCMIGELVTSYLLRRIFYRIHSYTVMVGVGFMVCIALERYLVIAWPLWYRFRRTIKTSVVVCVVVWFFPLVIYGIRYAIFTGNQNPLIVFGIFFLLPFPLLIFFLVRTVKALSAAISVPSDEKRRIVGTLVLVLLIYTLLFMPSIIVFFAENVRLNLTLNHMAFIFRLLNPLADLVLYIFMRRGMIDKLLASVCCCRIDSNDNSTASVMTQLQSA